MRHHTGSLALLVAPAILAIAGCAGNQGQASTLACAAVDQRIAPDATAGGLAGQYAFTVVATRGADQGKIAEGRLWLQENDTAMQQMTAAGGGTVPEVAAPLYGRMEIDLSTVGAVYAGNLTSDDPETPGVLVLERHGESKGEATTTITMRLGSLANRRDIVRFDGAFAALYVRSVGSEGFAGDWASGVTGRDAEGYFCAVRVDG